MSSGNGVTDCRRTILLKIMSYDSKQAAGIVHAADSNVTYKFQNFTQLLMYINEITVSPSDRISKKEDIFTMARNQSRNDFMHDIKSCSPEKRRSLSDFRIDIYFKNFGAWQGEMTCMDSGRSGAFRSVIEMALMLDHELESASVRALRKEAGS